MISSHGSIAAILATTLLGACGVFGKSKEERDRLSFYQENSARYYDAQRYDQAMELVTRGLELEPDDYKLLSTQAWCNLMQVDLRPGLLPVCEQQFEHLWTLREPAEHGAPVLLGRGRTQMRIGFGHWERARVLRESAAKVDPTQRAVREAEASEHDVRARHHFDLAKRSLTTLIDNEVQLRTAHDELMAIAVAEGDYQGAVGHGLSYLEHSHKEQQRLQERIDKTMQVREERDARVAYQDLIDEEIKVRTTLAEMQYRRNDYQASLAQLDALLTMDATRSTDYYNRARVLEALHRDDDARADYQKFLSSTKLPFGHEKVTRAFEFTRKSQAAQPPEND